MAERSEAKTEKRSFGSKIEIWNILTRSFASLSHFYSNLSWQLISPGRVTNLSKLGFCDYIYDTFNCFRPIPAGETLYYQCPFASLEVCSAEPSLTPPAANGTFCPSVKSDNSTFQYYALRKCYENGTWEATADMTLCNQLKSDSESTGADIFRNFDQEQFAHELMDKIFYHSSIWPPLLSIIVSYNFCCFNPCG